MYDVLLKLFENKMLGRIFEHNGVEVTGT